MNDQGFQPVPAIQQQTLRAARYINIEGSAELAWATALLCWSVTTYGTIILRPKSLWLHAVLWIFFLFGAVAPLVLPRAIKRCITWPRTGYVSYRRDRKFWFSIILSVVISAIIGCAIPWLLQPEMRQAISEQIQRSSGALSDQGVLKPAGTWGRAVLIMFLISNPLLYLMMNAIAFKEHGWKWSLLVLMATGSVAISFLAPGNFFDVMRPLMLFIGLMWFISGAATLYSYLRRTAATPEPA